MLNLDSEAKNIVKVVNYSFASYFFLLILSSAQNGHENFLSGLETEYLTGNLIPKIADLFKQIIFSFYE